MPQSCSKKQTVLVVDDSLLILEALSSLIGDEYDVLVAMNGEEAIELAVEESPDLILLDVVMPERDGYEILSILKSTPCTTDIPVIFLTGMGGEADEIRGLRMGAVDYIVKPFVPEIVRARVRTHLELKRSRDLLHRLALMDGLTGIANRRCFNDRLGVEWARSLRTQTPLSLILADIDHFKPYNDFYGHPAGDSCLVQVACALERESLRPSDLAARFGGEEFTLLLPETDLPGAILVAERIQAHIGKLAIRHENSAVSPQVTLSLGIASLIAVPGMTADQLIQEADERLYEAKQQGRNQIRCAAAAGNAGQV
jgi:diguanylate cyclase (GGDEF)-like protein